MLVYSSNNNNLTTAHMWFECLVNDHWNRLCSMTIILENMVVLWKRFWSKVTFIGMSTGRDRLEKYRQYQLNFDCVKSKHNFVRLCSIIRYSSIDIVLKNYQLQHQFIVFIFQHLCTCVWGEPMVQDRIPCLQNTWCFRWKFTHVSRQWKPKIRYMSVQCRACTYLIISLKTGMCLKVYERLRFN